MSKIKECYYCHKKEGKLYSLRNTTTRGKDYICQVCNTKKMKRYRSTLKGKKAVSDASKRAYIKHREKWIARAKARFAIKEGFILKPNKCEVCEKLKPLQAHHEDYSKPLQVIFLCYSCHAEADKLLENK